MNTINVLEKLEVMPALNQVYLAPPYTNESLPIDQYYQKDSKHFPCVTARRKEHSSAYTVSDLVSEIENNKDAWNEPLRALIVADFYKVNDVWSYAGTTFLSLQSY